MNFKELTIMMMDQDILGRGRLTWDEFKRRVEAEGVTGSDVIAWIDISDLAMDALKVVRYCGTVEIHTYEAER